MKPEIYLPDVTYIGAFLTFRCNYRCAYCINKHGDFKHRAEMTGAEWVEALNRIRVDRHRMVPITFQGGEPTVHKGWLDILQGLKDEHYVDMLTNFSFDLDEFIKAVPPERFERDVPYAPIRISYHPSMADYDVLLDKARKLYRLGYDVGVFVVAHPDFDIEVMRWKAEQLGLDFRVKEFLGWHNGRLYGHYRYPEAVQGARVGKSVMCKSNELLIAPDGYIHKCHRDLYAGQNEVGHILDDNLKIEFKFRPCHNFGLCNECDVKLKNNRFQEFGTCSVEINNE